MRYNLIFYINIRRVHRVALLKFLQGKSSKLTGEVLKAAEEGWIYVTKDTGNMYIKTAAAGSHGHIQLNSQYAYALRDGLNSLFNVDQQTGTIERQTSLETGYPVTFSNGIPVVVKSVMEAEHADAADEAISATKLSKASPITLSGDIAGTANGNGDASGWSINTNLSTTGVTAGQYGEGNVSYGTDGVAIPRVYFTVDAKGRITSATEESIKISPVSTTQPGVMTAADKVKLNGIATGATANIGTITGIQVNGTSIATTGVANIPAVTTTTAGVMTAADKVALNGKANKSTSQTITLTASGWSNSSQTVSVSNWTSSMNGICSIAANQSASVVQMAQKSGIFISNDTVNGKLTFSYFKSQPTSDIKMTIIMLG